MSTTQPPPPTSQLLVHSLLTDHPQAHLCCLPAHLPASATFWSSFVCLPDFRIFYSSIHPSPFRQRDCLFRQPNTMRWRTSSRLASRQLLRREMPPLLWNPYVTLRVPKEFLRQYTRGLLIMVDNVPMLMGEDAAVAIKSLDSLLMVYTMNCLGRYLRSAWCVTGLLGGGTCQWWAPFEWPDSGSPHKTLFKIEINFATNFTKLVAKRQDTSAR